jgi:hypothetical protein
VIDSVKTVGVDLIESSEKNNAKYCLVGRHHRTFKYGPDKVIEYAFKGGKTYVSKEVSHENTQVRVFMERIYKGKFSIFYLNYERRKEFYVDKGDGDLIRLIPSLKDPNNYRKQLGELTADCQKLLSASETINYNKKALEKFGLAYENCSFTKFRKIKFGISGGLDLSKPIMAVNDHNILDRMVFSYDQSYIIGLFLDIPISESYFSLHSELMFSRHSYSYNLKETPFEFDLFGLNSTVSLPLMLKYEYDQNAYQPFFNFGLTAAYHFQNDSELYSSLISGEFITIDKVIGDNLINDFQTGLSLGAGISRSITDKISVFIEARYNRFFGFNSAAYMNIDELMLLAGIRF